MDDALEWPPLIVKFDTLLEGTGKTGVVDKKGCWETP
jgi:hypothetical protein